MQPRKHPFLAKCVVIVLFSGQNHCSDDRETAEVILQPEPNQNVTTANSGTQSRPSNRLPVASQTESSPENMIGLEITISSRFGNLIQTDASEVDLIQKKITIHSTLEGATIENGFVETTQHCLSDSFVDSMRSRSEQYDICAYSSMEQDGICPNTSPWLILVFESGEFSLGGQHGCANYYDLCDKQGFISEIKSNFKEIEDQQCQE